MSRRRKRTSSLPPPSGVRVRDEYPVDYEVRLAPLVELECFWTCDANGKWTKYVRGTLPPEVTS